MDLYVIHHSPWSERARWALQHHRLAFHEHEHVPLLGEIALRVRAGTWTGHVSVPLLVADHPIVGSLLIAEYADSAGEGSKLFPEKAKGAIAELDLALDDAMRAARERFVRDLASDHEARLESLPAMMRILPLASTSARLGASFIARKYAATFHDIEERIRSGLATVRAALGGKPYIHGDFSFADVLGTSLVQTIAPVDDAFLTIPPATRRLWTHAGFGTEFADLIAWRDRVYATHRTHRT